MATVTIIRYVMAGYTPPGNSSEGQLVTWTVYDTPDLTGLYSGYGAGYLVNIYIDSTTVITGPTPSTTAVDAQSIWGVPITDPTLIPAENGWVWTYNAGTNSYVLEPPATPTVQAYTTIQSGLSSMPQRSILRFAPGPGVSLSDDGSATIATITPQLALVADLSVTLANGDSNFAVNLTAAGQSFTATGPTAPYSIGGIVGTQYAAYRGILRANQTCYIRNLSASAAAGHRIQTPTGGDMTLVAPAGTGFITVQFDWKPWVDSNAGGWVYAGW